MKLLLVDTIEEARQKLLDCTSHWKVPVEKTEILRAHECILAEDIVSPEDIPHFRRSTVDGYAVFSADTQGAGESVPALLKLTGSVEMGKRADITLCRGECVYVPTGAMLPDNADAMVMVEYSEIFDSDTIAIYESVAAGSHIVNIGEDKRQGEILLQKGTKIYCKEIGILAAAGLTEVLKFVPLKIAIISSGDELVSHSALPGAAEIRDINTLALCALARESLFEITVSQALKDDENLLEETIREVMKSCDVVVLSGGSSQGTKDMTEKVFSCVASPGVFTHGLAIKPGKPAILGYDRDSDTILAGLPGHPVSALMVFKVLLSWLTRQLTFQKEPVPIPAKITCNIAASAGRTTFQPVILRSREYEYFAEPVFGKAGMISTMTDSDGYIVIDMNKEGLVKGEIVFVYLWNCE